MRWLALLPAIALPVAAAELCVQDGEWICCHHLCDLYSPVQASGYSTDGPPDCGYGPSPFALSSSPSDPYANTGPLAEPFLYLWVVADAGYGFGSGYAHLSGDMSVFVFTPEQPNISWDATTQEFHVSACTYEPLLLASLLVFPTTDIEPSSWARIKALWADGP